MPRRIPASVTSAYNRAVKAQGDAAEKSVRRALGEFFRVNPAATAEEAREYAIELLRGAGDLYGAAASQAAYDLLQNVAYVDGMPMPDLGSWFYEADAEAIDRTAHYHAGKIGDGDVQGFIDQISAAARECAERGANETMSQAAQVQARRDGRSGRKGGRRRGARTYGIHFARVPMGPTTCPFCLMLASRGFVYLSEESAGEFDRFHRHCDCRIVPGTADTKVDGYDPAELYDRWKHPEKYADETDERMTPRQQLEAEARRLYIANGGGMGLSAEEAAERFDLLVDGNTDAQLRKYIERYSDEMSVHAVEPKKEPSIAESIRPLRMTGKETYSYYASDEERIRDWMNSVTMVPQKSYSGPSIANATRANLQAKDDMSILEPLLRQASDLSLIEYAKPIELFFSDPNEGRDLFVHAALIRDNRSIQILEEVQEKGRKNIDARIDGKIVEIKCPISDGSSAHPLRFIKDNYYTAVDQFKKDPNANDREVRILYCTRYCPVEDDLIIEELRKYADKEYVASIEVLKKDGTFFKVK